MRSVLPYLCIVSILSACGESVGLKNLKPANPFASKNANDGDDDVGDEASAPELDNLYTPRDYDNSTLLKEREKSVQSKDWVEADKNTVKPTPNLNFPKVSGACAKTPVNVRNLFLMLAKDMAKTDPVDQVVARVAKMIGMTREESFWNYSSITLHSTKRKEHLENRLKNFVRKKAPDGSVSMLASVDDFLNGLKDGRLKSKLNRETNFGLLQISANQFVRSYVQETLNEIHAQAAEQQEIKLRLKAFQNWCSVKTGYHDYQENEEAYIDLIKNLDDRAWSARKISKNTRVAGSLLALCPYFNMRMGYIIMQTSGYDSASDSTKLLYFGTRSATPECVLEIKEFLEPAEIVAKAKKDPDGGRVPSGLKRTKRALIKH